MKQDANQSCCPLLWDFTDRKQYHNRVKSTEQLKCCRRSTRESQWKGTCRVGLRSRHGHPAGRVLARKVRSGQKIWLRCTNIFF